ncbi:MAG: signal peptidase I [Desulfobacteraceae bacterium]|nr:signal peptidase I [Desulfobacteraceae bacterium]
MNEKFKQKLILFLKGWGVSILAALVIATSFKSAIADWNDVPTGSMIPTILPGDRIFINKLAYDLKIPYTTWHISKWDDPERGDIVVFFSPEDGKRLVKRVVGLPGDTIAMDRNHLLINNAPLDYAKWTPEKQTDVQILKQYSANLFVEETLVDYEHPVMLTPRRPSLHSFTEKKIPDGQYFMMGDNRDNSSDSRFFGFVKRKSIVGRAVAIAISRDLSERLSYLHPRWERFFKKLK